MYPEEERIQCQKLRGNLSILVNNGYLEQEWYLLRKEMKKHILSK